MKLYRPVGLKELLLIIESGYLAYPSRLPHQPIFYPVLNFEYAEQIARDWNSQDFSSDFSGFVTMFELDDDYFEQFEVKVVGSSQHQELWVPAERLQEFNAHIQGKIKIISAYYGEKFRGEIDKTTNLPITVNNIKGG